MLDALITSKTRIKLLLKFFLNSNSSAYLRSLESEFGESTNAIRVELNRFEEAGLLRSSTQGNRKYYQANKKHPLFPDINNIIFKYIGIDQVIDNVVYKLGHLERVYLCGEFARGCNSDILDLIFVGNIDKEYLFRLMNKVENLIQRRVRYIVYSRKDFDVYRERNGNEEVLLLWGYGKAEV